jgi:hypothetical protein
MDGAQLYRPCDLDLRLDDRSGPHEGQERLDLLVPYALAPLPTLLWSCCFSSVVSSRFHERSLLGIGFAWIRGELPAVLPDEPATG